MTVIDGLTDGQTEESFKRDTTQIGNREKDEALKVSVPLLTFVGDVENDFDEKPHARPGDVTSVGKAECKGIFEILQDQCTIVA